MKVRSMLPTLWGESAAERLPFRALQQEVDKLFNDFTMDFPLAGRWNKNGSLAMQVDVAETDKSLEVTAELPGVNEKEIDVSLAGDMLTIKLKRPGSGKPARKAAATGLAEDGE